MLAILLLVIGCTKDYPAVVSNKQAPPEPSGVTSTTACSCTTSPGSSTTVTSPVSITTSPPATVPQIDTLKVPAPLFSPDGGTFHIRTQVRLTADALPLGAVIEYSLDNGATWQTGSQFTLITGGTVLSRIRSGNKVSLSRSSAVFNLYFERMLVIGNSIMNHGPAPDLGWFNNNGMAASAPEKDFVHLLTGRLRAFYPTMTVTLQSGGNFERQFGTTDYSFDEFKESLQQVQPDLILVRLGENIDDSQVPKRGFETQLSQLLDGLANYGQPVRVVCTTSVWQQPQADAIIRKVTTEKGHALVDLSCMVGQSQYFASQYTNLGVAAHPNDTGMQRIADLIWEKLK
ncbi:SGNH/GDSL hydrolase family protein [Spirosoma radiotolerans]|uniref:SGNH/GDSL hydrolase family protein n=1 Tax=Spirosoma radiotolerans TaxID=1379870 RepID=UPI001D10A654|nr:SGNH/GDSL hydrolase family protein [Spirosoma radiotolerans]